MDVSICIGSSCHLKGSYDIIKKLQELVAENKLEDKVNLNASFCLGHCTDGVSVKVDNEYTEGFSVDNTVELFDKYIMSKIDGRA